jgi:hypothetical protein
VSWPEDLTALCTTLWGVDVKKKMEGNNEGLQRCRETFAEFN